MNETIQRMAEMAGIVLAEGGENLPDGRKFVLQGWKPLPKTDIMVRIGADYARAYDQDDGSLFVCGPDGDDDAVLIAVTPTANRPGRR